MARYLVLHRLVNSYYRWSWQCELVERNDSGSEKTIKTMRFGDEYSGLDARDVMQYIANCWGLLPGSCRERAPGVTECEIVSDAVHNWERMNELWRAGVRDIAIIQDGRSGECYVEIYSVRVADDCVNYTYQKLGGWFIPRDPKLTLAEQLHEALRPYGFVIIPWPWPIEHSATCLALACKKI